MKLIGILGVVLAKVLLDKGLALGMVLLLFWIKGKQIGFNADRWDDYFVNLPMKKINGFAAGIYLCAAVVSSAVSYALLRLLTARYALMIALLLFVVCAAVSAYRYHKYGEKRFRELPRKILERKTSENKEG